MPIAHGEQDDDRGEQHREAEERRLFDQPGMIRVRMSQLANTAAAAATGRLASARPAPYTATGTKKANAGVKLV